MIICPVQIRTYKVTQKFGERPEYYAKYGMKGHNGIDFAPKYAWSDKTIFAPHDGYVTLTKNEDGYGNLVTIQSLPREAGGIGHRSDLAHLSQFLVEQGQYVAASDPVGIMGSTGDSTGTHLHWTYKKTNKGVILNQDNGYKGALDIANFVLPLLRQSIL